MDIDSPVALGRHPTHTAIAEALRPYVVGDERIAATAALEAFWPPPTDGFTCPLCARTSYHPRDLQEGFCDAGHDWTGATRVG